MTATFAENKRAPPFSFGSALRYAIRRIVAVRIWQSVVAAVGSNETSNVLVAPESDADQDPTTATAAVGVVAKSCSAVAADTLPQFAKMEPPDATSTADGDGDVVASTEQEEANER